MLEDKNVIRGLMFCLTYQIDLPRTLISICTSSCIKYTNCAAETEKLIKPIENKIRCELNHQVRLCVYAINWHIFSDMELYILVFPSSSCSNRLDTGLVGQCVHLHHAQPGQNLIIILKKKKKKLLFSPFSNDASVWSSEHCEAHWSYYRKPSLDNHGALYPWRGMKTSPVLLVSLLALQKTEKITYHY